MTFVGAGAPFAPADFVAARTELGVDEATLWTLLGVETHGFGFLPDRRPVILFERHIFHLRTRGRFDRTHPGISSRHPGGYRGGEAEYDRLAEAIGLAERAALESTSWGLGQIMGFNAPRAGFSDVSAMVASFVETETAQLAAVARFLRAAPALLAALRARNWPEVAFFYNGAGYRAGHYDTKLALTHRALEAGDLRPNFSVREAQAWLHYLRYLRAAPDGMDGPETALALAAFRHDRHLPPGDLGPGLLAALRSAAAVLRASFVS